MSRLFLIAASTLLLSACGEASAVYNDPLKHLYQAGAIFLGADVVSLASTNKTIDDHVIGIATDQDCSTLRASHGGPYCIPYPPPVAMISITEYCYKSLARASCFTQPDPSDEAMFMGSRTYDVPAP